MDATVPLTSLTSLSLDSLVDRGYAVQVHGIVRGAREVSVMGVGSHSPIVCVKLSPKTGRIIRAFITPNPHTHPEVKVVGVANVRQALAALPTQEARRG